MALDVSGNIAINDARIRWRNVFEPLAPGSTRSERSRQVFPLQNVPVRVVGLYKPGRWTIAEGRTDDDGNFRLVATESARTENEPLTLRVDIRLNDADIIVHQGGRAEERGWLSILGTTTPTLVRQHDLGQLWFDRDSGNTRLSNPDNVIAAIFFHAGRKLIWRLRGEDPAVAFKGKVFVKWPARPVTGQSYATNITKREVHVQQDMGTVDTLFHEMMHIWNYDHNKGMTRWWTAFVSLHPRISVRTDNRQEPFNIAFHEGFAEFARMALERALFGGDPNLPSSRGLLAVRGLGTLTQAQRNGDAVVSALRCLIHPDLLSFEFGSPSDGAVTVRQTDPPPGTICPPPPGFTIFDVLRIFPGMPGTFFDESWDAGRQNNGIVEFLGRIRAMSELGFRPQLTDAMTRLIVNLIDPESTMEPRDLCRTLTATGPIIPVDPPDDPPAPKPPRRRPPPRRGR